MDDTDQRRIDAGNDIDLKWLRSFVVVAEEASFTRAASRVHVAQPGVSAQVRRLESELGQQLLDRSGRSVRLTEVGSAVLPFARAALDAVANARLAVDELAGLVRGQVTVGMVSGCALPILAELLAAFHDRYPGVAITLVEEDSAHHQPAAPLSPGARLAPRPLGQPCRPGPYRAGASARTTRAASVLSNCPEGSWSGFTSVITSPPNPSPPANSSRHALA
jgi:DNA-binding transcriptional LysR family regulator